MIVRALSEKHAVSVILGIYDSGEVKKMQIMDFGPSINTIDALLKTMADEGIISVREEMQGRRVFLISLTEKGKRVAAILDTIRKEFPDVQNLHGYKLYR
jgi:DNA-binding PadR family transcriptional regulator